MILQLSQDVLVVKVVLVLSGCAGCDGGVTVVLGYAGCEGGVSFLMMCWL